MTIATATNAQVQAIFDCAPQIYDIIRSKLIELKLIMPASTYQNIKDDITRMMCYLPAKVGTMRENIRYQGNADGVLDMAFSAVRLLNSITPIRLHIASTIVEEQSYITSVWVEQGIARFENN